MKAIVCTRYGSPDVLQLQEVAKPAPNADQVLIKIHAAFINSRDWRLMRANPFFMRLVSGGFLRPKNKILGADVAGRVEATGSSVKQFKPGDEVFGYLPSSTGRGTFAEYVCANENAITLKPADLTFEQAAAVPMAAITALQGLSVDLCFVPVTHEAEKKLPAVTGSPGRLVIKQPKEEQNQRAARSCL